MKTAVGAAGSGGGGGTFDFGAAMIAGGHLTEAQLDAAVRHQRVLASRGEHRAIYDVVVDLGFAGTAEVRGVLRQAGL